MVQSIKVKLTLNVNKNVAKEAAYAVMMRANPHDSQLVESKLEELNINEETLTKYFTQLSLVVTEFWNAQHDISFSPTLKPHEVRGLYLPLIYSVIFASVGNCKVGNYEYLLVATRDELHTVEKDWLIKFSADLESVRQYIKGNVGQIGNRGAQPQTPVMLSLLGSVSEDKRNAELKIRDGQTFDRDLAGLATLVGLSLVDSAYSILYTGIEEVNFRELMGTIIQRNPSDAG